MLPPSPRCVASAWMLAVGAIHTASAWRRLGSRPCRPPPTVMVPPPVAPEASSMAPSSSAIWRPLSVSPPPVPPALPALVLLPVPSVSRSCASSTMRPPWPSPSASARTMPSWFTSAAIRSTCPPAAAMRPRFSAVPAGASSRTAMCGRCVSTSSTLWPAASSTWPPGASIRPSLRTPALPPTSRMRPPSSACSVPWLTSAPAVSPWVSR